MVDLAREFSSNNVRVEIIVLTADGPLKADVPANVPIISLGHKRAATSLVALTRYLRAARPRVVMSTLEHMNVLSVVAAKLMSGARVYVREANSLSRDLSTSGRIAPVLRFLMGLTYRRADGVIAVSEGVRSDLEAAIGLQSSRVHVIYNPVITERILALSAEPTNHPWFSDGGPPIILGVGRLDRQKRFDVLLRAFTRVRTRTPARLVIFGEGPLRTMLSDLADELGIASDVSLPGFVDNPFPYMRGAAAFALSSDWEGLPNVLVQARALGTPVVSTDCPSGPTEILDGGVHGALVPVGDDASLADALHHALGQGRTPPPDAWVRRFDATHVAAQYLNVLGIGTDDDGGRSPRRESRG